MNTFIEPFLHVALHNRRTFLRRGGMLLAANSLLGRLSLQAADSPSKAAPRSCILVWLAGGPSQFETWDPKPGTKNGGPTKAIATAIPGVQIAEHWPQVARSLGSWAVLRSMTNKEGSHDRATYQLHTGRRPTGSLKFPNLGSVMAEQLGDPGAELPNFVSIGPTVGSGFLGVHAQPFIVGRAGAPPDNVAMDVNAERFRRRQAELEQANRDFEASAGARLVDAQRGLYAQGARMMLSPKLKAFQLDGETDTMRAAYGRGGFGQGLLVARRLVEAGVRFVEVHRGGWDHHQKLFQDFPKNAAEVDHGLAGLIGDLKQRGLLDRTLVVCMGEFGRTPVVNARAGRDHWPKTFSLLLAGAGVRGGQAIGKTNGDGSDVAERPISVEDLFQSFCRALALDAGAELTAPNGRPLAIVDGGQVISGLF